VRLDDFQNLFAGLNFQMIAAVSSQLRASLITAALASLFLLRLHATLAQELEQEFPETPKAAHTVSAGRQTFTSICASCHGLDGKGGERGPDIATRPEITRLSDQEIMKVLRVGVPGKGMPPFAALGPAKLSALLRYVRSLQGKGTTVAVSGDPKKGKELFSGKAGCSECHMVNGAGGFLGPDLSNYGQTHPANDIHAVIVSPEKTIGRRQPVAEVTSKDGKTYSGLVRNEDNFSMQLQSMDGTFHLFSKSELDAIKYRPESLMPTDYGTRLSTEELDALAAYLVGIAHAKQKP
jgi:cytochrome c oxidase cbb3-type subunit 3